MPFFLSAFLFFFLSFFLALLVFFFLSFLSWYTERAPTRTRVCCDSTHTGELSKRLLDVPLLKHCFFVRSFVVVRAAAPVGVVGCLFGFRFCAFFLFVFVSVMSRPLPRFPSFVFLASGVAPALPFFAFFCPLTPFFRLARLFYQPLFFRSLYRAIF